MLNRPCVKVVQSLLKRLGKADDLCTLPTTPAKYLTSQVFLFLGLCTGFKQNRDRFTQAKLGTFSPFRWAFYTSSTSPITNTNLIKGMSYS